MNHRARLLARRDELRHAIASREGIAVERFAGPIDSIWTTIAREAQARQMDSLAGQLQDVEAALAAGTEYGICQDCGHRIPAARLKAVPWAVRCTGCQAAVEEAPAL